MIFLSHEKKKGWTRTLTSTRLLDFQKENTSFEQDRHMRGWNFNLTGDGAYPGARRGGRSELELF